MNCSNCGFNNHCNFGFQSSNCACTNIGRAQRMGCGCFPCQPCNPCNGGCPRPQPIVMPTQVQISHRITQQEQPIVVPIERRNINQCMYIPKYCPVVQNTYYNQM